jgi:hypothetical protein
LIDPAVREVVVIVRGGLTVMVLVAVLTAAVGVCESVTCTLNVVVPKTVGVPLITPPALILKPGGNVPEARVHVNGCFPPPAVKVAE